MKSQILIVDDIPSNLNFVSDILYSEDFRIIVATNGKDAVNIAIEKLPDLILLDISMPDMDGFDVCKILKADPKTRDIPIIFLTAKVEHDDIIKGFDAGAVDYVSKPFHTTELVSRVKTHLDLKNKTQQLKQLNQVLEEKVKERTFQLEESNQNLVKANQKLSRAYKDISKLDKAKNEFIRHINHELRTPLQGIHGLVRILKDTVISNEEKEYIHSISILVKRLIKLAELSLLFTELKTDNYHLELERINISKCIEHTLNNFEQPDKSIRFNTDNINTNLFVNADQKLLCACFNIIIDNAIKYSPENSMIELNTYTTDDNLVIEFSDKGPGFSKKAQTQMFELFSADNISQNSYGFGMGLATAKIILDLLSAQMEIENIARGGAKIKLIFPKI